MPNPTSQVHRAPVDISRGRAFRPCVIPYVQVSLEPGDVNRALPPTNGGLDVEDPEAGLAAESKLTLLSEKWTVIIPDKRACRACWLANHSCQPNAADLLHARRRIQCTRTIQPGPEGDDILRLGYETPSPSAISCRCGSPRCRGYITSI